MDGYEDQDYRKAKRKKRERLPPPPTDWSVVPTVDEETYYWTARRITTRAKQIGDEVCASRGHHDWHRVDYAETSWGRDLFPKGLFVCTTCWRNQWNR